MRINRCYSKKKLLGYAFVFMTLLCQTAIAGDNESREKQRLEGVWRVSGMISAGEMQSDDGHTIYSFDQGKLEIHSPPQPIGRMEYRIVRDANPSRLDLILNSSVEVEHSEMIYGFDAGHLWICYAPPQQPRPTSIASNGKNQWTLIVFERHADSEHSEQIVAESDKDGTQELSPLDRAFGWHWGTTGKFDRNIAKRFALEAERQGSVTARMWIAFCRNGGFFGYEKDIPNATRVAIAALPELQHEAARNDLDALFLLGIAKRYGLGMEEDLEHAEQSFRKAAANGHSPSMLHLAYLLISLEKHHESNPWLARAALFHNASAMGALAFNYAHGRGIRKDTEEAVVWYERASLIGQLASMNDLGRHYEQLQGQREKAYSYYCLAADAGDADGLYEKGRCLQYGIGVHPDLFAAIRCYEKASGLGQVMALNNLGVVFDECKVYVKAARYFTQAAENGNALSMFNLGLYYNHGHGVARDIAKARHWLELSAQNGHDEAKQALRRLDNDASGYTYQSSTGVRQGREAAAQRAAERAVRRFRQQIGQ